MELKMTVMVARVMAEMSIGIWDERLATEPTLPTVCMAFQRAMEEEMTMRKVLAAPALLSNLSLPIVVWTIS